MNATEQTPALVVGYGGFRSFTGLPWTDQTIRRQCKKGSVPTPLRVGDTGVSWRSDMLLRWLDDLPSFADKPVKRRKAKGKRRAKT